MRILPLEELKREFPTCPICGVGWKNEGVTMEVDFDRNTGAVRGLICFNCLTMLHGARQDTYTMKAGVSYIRKYEESKKE